MLDILQKLVAEGLFPIILSLKVFFLCEFVIPWEGSPKPNEGCASSFHPSAGLEAGRQEKRGEK